ncbi:MAG: Carboxyl-terminal protease [uncultured Sulfurovum sp.]|uniref:Carboxyl-terminal protease n=1 Tax=uncultured Sulfurovum sp. TaxID=269237 RepID=A0A6S6T4X1_9BACT|nr:MAG: Carboxyl-terminal protease [uncultured Sulfurovum sp.]
MVKCRKLFRLFIFMMGFFLVVGCGGESKSSSDTTAPIIKLNGESKMTVLFGSTFLDKGATAVDNVDGSVRVGVSGEVDSTQIGTYIITYSAEDKSGNKSSLTRTVSVAYDCSLKGQNKLVYGIMKDAYLWYEHVDDLAYDEYTNTETLLEDLKYEKYDRWSYISSLSSYTNYFEEGTYLGFGFSMRLLDEKIYISLIYKDSPAHLVGIERGSEILEIEGKTIQEITAQDLWNTILGSEEVGVERTFKVKTNGTTSTVSIKKAIVTAHSVIESKTLELEGKKVGYLVFNKFIEPSLAELSETFEAFKKDGIEELILDLRYNGGGRLHIAQYLASLIGGDKSNENVFNTLKFNDRYTNWNFDYKFTDEINHLSLDRVYVITTENTASASEYVINGLTPFLDVHLIGSKTHGKPVGMRGFTFCEKHLSPIQFQGVNAEGYGDYFDGIAPSCTVEDDILHPFGDENEAMLKETLYFMGNNKCSINVQKTAKQEAPSIEYKRVPQKGLEYEIDAF